MKANMTTAADFLMITSQELLTEALAKLKIKVPESEKKILRALQQLNEATAPAIVKSSGGTISLASVYELLKRLKNKNLVTIREEYFDVGGIQTRRVFYKINESVIKPKNQIN